MRRNKSQREHFSNEEELLRSGIVKRTNPDSIEDQTQSGDGSSPKGTNMGQAREKSRNGKPISKSTEKSLPKSEVVNRPSTRTNNDQLLGIHRTNAQTGKTWEM